MPNKILSMTKIELSAYPDHQALLERVRKIRHVALDMDGTIYKGNTLFPYTVPFLARLKAMGVGYSFLTNNPSKSIAGYLKHLKTMGLPVTADELYTSAQATVNCLKTNYPAAKRLFILGTPDMMSEFEKAGYISTADDPTDEPDAVVVGFDMTLTYWRLCRAAWWIHCGKPYVATNPDRVCPTDQPTILVDCGSICAMLEKATGRKPDITLGKPLSEMLDGILNTHGLHPCEVAVAGDRVYTDMLMAHKAGAFGALVLSGEATMSDANKANPLPDVTLQSIEQLGELIAEAKKILPLHQIHNS